MSNINVISNKNLKKMNIEIIFVLPKTIIIFLKIVSVLKLRKQHKAISNKADSSYPLPEITFTPNSANKIIRIANTRDK